jgi:hypothetical protein
MRYFVVVALIALGDFLTERRKILRPKNGGSGAQATLTPASEHDWAKTAIDRTNEVRQKVKRERASNEVP